MTRTLEYTIDLETGIIIAETYRSDGILHREEHEGPAVIERSSSGYGIVGERYYWRGQLHRNDGPAKILYADDRSCVVVEEYYRHGKPHRDPKDGPARITRGGRDGSVVVFESYHVHGERYRNPLDGPCAIGRSNDGRTEYETYSDPKEMPVRSAKGRKKLDRGPQP